MDLTNWADTYIQILNLRKHQPETIEHIIKKNSPQKPPNLRYQVLTQTEKWAFKIGLDIEVLFKIFYRLGPAVGASRSWAAKLGGKKSKWSLDMNLIK